MMKRYIMWLLGLLILSACTNDEYLAQRTEVEEGIPTVVRLRQRLFLIVVLLIYMCFPLKRIMMSL